MARTVNSIYQQILTTIANDPVLGNQLTSTSAVSIFRLWAFYIATSQAIEEQNNDLFVNQVESLVDILPPATQLWIQAQAFNFQYSATTPQIIQFATASLAPFYPVVNPAYRIITNCSVNTTLALPGFVNILVAKGSTSSVPQQLVNTELQALQFYFNQIKPAGISYNCVSLPADRLYSVFTVYVQSAYASTIGSSLLAAYNNYLFNLSFAGTIQLFDIMSALRSVSGVIDLFCTKMVVRPASTSFGGGVVIVNASTTYVTSLSGPGYQTIAGYIEDESSPNDFLSNITIIYL